MKSPWRWASDKVTEWFDNDPQFGVAARAERRAAASPDGGLAGRPPLGRPVGPLSPLDGMVLNRDQRRLTVPHNYPADLLFVLQEQMPDYEIVRRALR